MAKSKDKDAEQAVSPNPNTTLWEGLQTTNPKYTKRFDRGGFKGTAINGTYIAKRLTEAFGPCGIGWRLVIDDERIIPGPVGADGGQEQLHVVRCHLEYRKGVVFAPPDGAGVNQNSFPVDPQWHSTGPQFGQTKLVLRTKNGLMFDEEAPKKSITDAMSKCASLLGVGADVHLGMYDDNKYMRDLHASIDLLTAEQETILINALNKAGVPERAFCAKYELAEVTDLPASKLAEALDGITAYEKAKAAHEKAKAEKAATPPADTTKGDK